jgi:hypothetical protein
MDFGKKKKRKNANIESEPIQGRKDAEEEEPERKHQE